MKTKIPIDIITCPEWKASPPRKDITVVAAKAVRIIFHHTAGHHPEISNPANESLQEFVAWMHQIQSFHMSPSPTDPSKPWIDSGHNFLVGRNGMIGQGRWQTVSAIQNGHMVVSAHCPGQNTQIGIEHEHAGNEEMTPKQREASARLMAWIAGQYGRKTVLPVDPHSRYVNTACPANLVDDIASTRKRAQKILKESML